MDQLADLCREAKRLLSDLGSATTGKGARLRTRKPIFTPFLEISSALALLRFRQKDLDSAVTRSRLEPHQFVLAKRGPAVLANYASARLPTGQCSVEVTARMFGVVPLFERLI